MLCMSHTALSLCHCGAGAAACVGCVYLYVCACPALLWHCVGHLHCPVLVLPDSFVGCVLVRASGSTFVQHCCCLSWTALISAVPCLPALPWSEKGVVAWAFGWVGVCVFFFASTPHPDFTLNVADFCAPFLFGHNHYIFTYIFLVPPPALRLCSCTVVLLCVRLWSG